MPLILLYLQMTNMCSVRERSHYSEVLPCNSPCNVYRKDRHNDYGGSLLLIKNRIISDPLDISTNYNIIFRNIECSNSQTLIFGSAYRQTNNDVNYTTKLIGAIKIVCHKYIDAVIWIAGDFNFLDVDWSNNIITKTCLFKYTENFTTKK